MRRTRTYRTQTIDLVELLGIEVARARRERRETMAELAERARTSTATISRIERGDPSVAIGTVFEVATLAGVALFGVDADRLPAELAQRRTLLALLPTRIRPDVEPVFDDF